MRQQVVSHTPAIRSLHSWRGKSRPSQQLTSPVCSPRRLHPHLGAVLSFRCLSFVFLVHDLYTLNPKPRLLWLTAASSFGYLRTRAGGLLLRAQAPGIFGGIRGAEGCGSKLKTRIPREKPPDPTQLALPSCSRFAHLIRIRSRMRPRNDFDPRLSSRNPRIDISQTNLPTYLPTYLPTCVCTFTHVYIVWLYIYIYTHIYMWSPPPP